MKRVKGPTKGTKRLKKPISVNKYIDQITSTHKYAKTKAIYSVLNYFKIIRYY